jgi:hypothetical protein
VVWAEHPEPVGEEGLVFGDGAGWALGLASHVGQSGAGGEGGGVVRAEHAQKVGSKDSAAVAAPAGSPNLGLSRNMDSWLSPLRGLPVRRPARRLGRGRSCWLVCLISGRTWI